MIQSIVQPKMPNNPAWRAKGKLNHGYDNCIFFHPKLNLSAISAVEVPDGEPEYHLSISKKGPRRCSKQEALMVVKQFGMEDALEDNHSSIIRSFWMPVAEKHIGNECDCKAQETAIIEGDFEWRPLL